MRRSLLMLGTLLCVGPLAAQNFEGTIEMQLTDAKAPEPIRTTVYLKGTTMAMVMTLPSSAGPMAGQQARMVLNRASQKMTTLMPAPPGMPLPPGSKGMKMVTDLTPASTEADPDLKLTKLGTSQTIAGMRCDDYTLTSDAGETRMCVTTALGRFTLPSLGGPDDAPAWTRAFGDKPAFPLKVWQEGGSSTGQMEVVSVNRGPVPAEMLNESPTGYVDMSSMMPGRRP